MKTSSDTRLILLAPRAISDVLVLQRGMSLIELMVSITLGLIILSALSTLFINQTRSRVELDKSNRMIDNGRYAMELLAQDLRLSGYLGEYVPPLSACSSIPVGIDGRDAGLATKPSTTGFTNLSATNVREGSDIVVVRRASTSTPTAQTSAVPGVKYLQVSLCQYDTLPYLIGSPSTAPTGDPAGVSPQDFFILRKKSCKFEDTKPYNASNLADVRRMVEHVYFVSPDNEPGDGIPTLKRQETNPLTGARDNVPLVEGIELMQVEYGIDSNQTFQILAETNAGSLVLSELTANPVTARIKQGMGVYGQYLVDTYIPDGYKVASMTQPDPVTGVLGTITTEKVAGSGPIVSSPPAPPAVVRLTIPYLTATVTPGSNVLTNVSAEPIHALVKDGYEICALGLGSGTTITSYTEPPTSPIEITLSKPASSCDPTDPFASCPLVPLNIPAIAISPRPVAGDGVADEYSAAPSAAQWANVVSVKLTIVARNTEPTENYVDTKTYALGRDANGAVQTYGPINDNYKRHVYTQFIRLVNISGRRE